MTGIRYEDMTDKEHKQRTTQQNKALHLYCKMLSEALNDAGLDMKATLKPEVAIPWTMENVKNSLWRPIQEALTGKHSTIDLDSVNPSDIHAILNRHMAEKFGISIEWPSRQ